MTSQNSPISIVPRAAKACLAIEHCPHLVITDALDPTIFEQLSSPFPADDVIRDGWTARDTWFDYPACKVVADPPVSPQWREFFAYQASHTIFGGLAALAGPQMRALKPDLEQDAGLRLEDFKVGMRPSGRGDPWPKGADASKECQSCLNYTRHRCIVGGPHVDSRYDPRGHAAWLADRDTPLINRSRMPQSLTATFRCATPTVLQHGTRKVICRRDIRRTCGRDLNG